MQDKQKGGVRQTRIKEHRDSKRGAANIVDSQGNEDDPVYAFAVDNKMQEKIEAEHDCGFWSKRQHHRQANVGVAKEE